MTSVGFKQQSDDLSGASSSSKKGDDLSGASSSSKKGDDLSRPQAAARRMMTLVDHKQQ